MKIQLIIRGAGLLAGAASILALPTTLQAQGDGGISRLPHTLFQPSGTVQNKGGAPEENQTPLAEWPKKNLVLPPTTTDEASRKAADQEIEEFVAKNAKVLGMEGNVAKLKLTSVRDTPTGRQINLEQRIDDVPIVNGNLQLTVNKEGTVITVSRDVVAVPESALPGVSKKTSLEPKAAQELAWKDLKPTGELLEPPTVDKAYVLEEKVLTLVYVVRLAVSEPFGYWEYYVDADTGRIVSKRDRRIKDGKRADPEDAGYRPANAPVVDLAAALAKLQAVQKAPEAPPEAKNAVANALVFCPNPISTLKNPALRDGDSATKFEAAYIKVELKDLEKSGGTLHLKGPLARIEDFEAGEGQQHRAPSTEAVEWTAKRGNNAFNDVMTYHYIHQSMTYLRKLGYEGTKDLFPNGIAADSDGVSGRDQSHYVPLSDRLAFGHGCIDDNEDTDVILHEFGHAITNHIDPQWGDGDSDAIGEGFGDYWAVSSRMRMTDGMAVDGLKVFIWDAADGCWGGRRADKTTAQYDPNKTYGAHKPMGGFESDELWSTPLVSALLELTQAGETHESVDQVVLAGMSGVGSGFTMRTLALATVQQANLLFPGKPHAAVFEKHFKNHKIIE